MKTFLTFILLMAVPAMANGPSVVEQVSLNPGDVVISINGKKMKNNLVAFKTLGEVKTPSRLVMEVLHNGKIQKSTYDLK